MESQNDLGNNKETYEHVQHRHAITIYVLFGILSIINITYFFARILKLEQKQFHVMMFVLLQVAYFSHLCEYIWWNDDLPSYILGGIYNILDETSHCIFAVKYWVLSRQIYHLCNSTEDKNLQKKARILLILQFLLIVSTSIALILMNVSELDFKHKKKGVIAQDVFYSLPAYISFFILAEALWKLRGFETNKNSLSKYQLAIQFTAGLSFAVAGTVFYIRSSDQGIITIIWYIGTFLDWFSLLILTLTLAEIAKLQLHH